MHLYYTNAYNMTIICKNTGTVTVSQVKGGTERLSKLPMR